ncbi:hypothetical protein Tco_0696962 [Tanacetum coccineum]
MEKLSFDLNVHKESSDTDEAAKYGGNPMSVTFKIHHGRCFTPTPNKSYVGGHVSSVDVVDIDEFCLNDLKQMVVKLGFKMPKYVKDNKIILVYVEQRSSNVDSSIFVTPYKYLLYVNRNLTLCHSNLTKEWEHVSSKALSIGEVMKTLSKKHPASSVEGTIIKETVDSFDGLNEILGDYANTGEEITGKQMIVHISNSSTVKNVVDNDMLFKTEAVDPIGNFKGVEVDIYSKTEEEGDIEENDTSDSDSEDLDYDPKHNEVFDDDEKYT